jgi:hypothetical protein
MPMESGVHEEPANPAAASMLERSSGCAKVLTERGR